MNLTTRRPCRDCGGTGQIIVPDFTGVTVEPCETCRYDDIPAPPSEHYLAQRAEIDWSYAASWVIAALIILGIACWVVFA